MWESVVIGAGQAGLSAAHHLQRLGVQTVVLDANPAPGGAWQHRWDSLSMHDVHGVSDLPGLASPGYSTTVRANQAVPDYFARYEAHFDLAVQRPVSVRAVHRVDDDPASPLRVEAGDQSWLTRTIINATGTWNSPFWPHYPGRGQFRGRQLHTANYNGPDEFAGQHVLVVGGGLSAVQTIGELAHVAETTWVTRRPPTWRNEDFDPDAGRRAVALVEDRVRRGLPPRSVVSVTGLMLRPQEQLASTLGRYRARPMFERITETGVAWADGSSLEVDVILWATGFRPSINHLRPLGLRNEHGGITLLAPYDSHAYVTAARDNRVQFVGYGPSASTIGANRAGRAAALAVRDQLRVGQPAPHLVSVTSR